MSNPLQLVQNNQAVKADTDPKLTTVYLLQTEINEHQRIANEYRSAEAYAKKMAKAEEDIVHQLRLTVTGLTGS